MNCDDFCDNFDIVCSVHVSLNAFMDEIEGGSGMCSLFVSTIYVFINKNFCYTNNFIINFYNFSIKF